MRVGALHDQRAGQPHLGMEQADRIGSGVVGAEGIGADELGEAIRLVRVGAADRTHFVQHDRHAGLLPPAKPPRSRQGRRR